MKTYPSDANSTVFLAAFSWSSIALDHSRDRTLLLYSDRIGIGTTSTVSWKDIALDFFLGCILRLGRQALFDLALRNGSAWASYLSCSWNVGAFWERGWTQPPCTIVSWTVSFVGMWDDSMPMLSKNFRFTSCEDKPLQFAIGDTAEVIVGKREIVPEGL